MKCIICDSRTEYYFTKIYTEQPYAKFMVEIGPVDYHKCIYCGFTFSKTHRVLEDNKWQQLNYQFHHYFEDTPIENRLANPPPYAEQAFMLSVLGKNAIIDTADMLDYAGGHGTLSKILYKYFHIKLTVFEPYVIPSDVSPNTYIPVSELKKYNTVINSAMFEHVRTREDLDKLNNLVKENGTLIIHTVVPEVIPKDPNWFYLTVPVHTAFHTNKSMELLMKQWGYISSIYSPKSKCWILLRTNDIERLKMKINEINRELQYHWFFVKIGFMDYWK